MEEKDFWIAFSVFPGVGPVTFQKLLQHFSSAKKAWHASDKEITIVLGEKRATAFCLFRTTFSLEEYRQKLERANVCVVTRQDSLYPQLLKKGQHPPFVLYAKGNVQLLHETQTMGVVGTRKITQYGRDVTELFTETLVRAGCSIVSGLAMGVDAIAHQTTIDMGGKTIAVLGCGVDCCYPQENQRLYDAILDTGGLILSEMPLGMAPNKGTFPARNRIVAGLSQGMLVTEGAEDSGALITASDSLKLSRPVFAVPGPITSSLSKGPYKLIAQGAILVTKPEDILTKLRISNGASPIGNKKIRGDSKQEQEIIDILSHEPLSFDELVRSTKIDSHTLAALVSVMEIKGMLVSSGGVFSLAIDFAY